MVKITVIFSMLFLLAGCVQKTVKPDDPYYAPVSAANLRQPNPITGSIVNLSSRRDLYGNGRAAQVGDIISIELNESTKASKKAKTSADKSSSTALTSPTVFGNTWG